jgi:hypothetical protein
VFDKTDTNAGIVKVTELGIFDQNHNLMAYATFPPVEYKSDTQHFSTYMMVSDSNF